MSGLREDVKRLFLQGSGQSAAVLRIGPYRKLLSVRVLDPG